MRCVISILVLVLPVMLGCACTDQTSGDCTRVASPPAEPATELASTLLFDARPGYYRASDFAYRSSWPSTDAFYSTGEVIYFDERFIDIQDRGFGSADYTYLRSDTRRVGVGYR